MLREVPASRSDQGSKMYVECPSYCVTGLACSLRSLPNFRQLHIRIIVGLLSSPPLPSSLAHRTARTGRRTGHSPSRTLFLGDLDVPTRQGTIARKFGITYEDDSEFGEEKTKRRRQCVNRGRFENASKARRSCPPRIHFSSGSPTVAIVGPVAFLASRRP